MPELFINIDSDTEWSGESHRIQPRAYCGPIQPKYLPASASPLLSETTTTVLPSLVHRARNAKLPASTPYVDSKKSQNAPNTTNDISLLNAVKANYRFIYRINDGVGTTNTILQKVCDDRGWKEFEEISLLNPNTSPYERAMRGATGWNLWWSYSIYQFSPYKFLRNWQFTNHNPKGFQFCNKLYLTLYMRKMQVLHGSPFDFYPLSFVVPEDYSRLSIEHLKRSEESFTEYNYNNLLSEKPIRCCSTPVPAAPKASQTGFYNYLSSPYSGQTTSRPRSVTAKINRPTSNSYWSMFTPDADLPSNATTANTGFNPVWISKPVALSQGKGIFLTTDLNAITTEKKSVVQEYITRPLLIGGYKWDVRIYVCVAAIDPLVIYVYQEGLCRFCTEKYNTKDLSGTYSHLTNASLNKLSPTYEKDKELIGQGCKWSLRQLRQHFKERNICDWLLWQKVMAMVVLTIVGDALRLGYSASNKNCFDLFGFDVLVDENLKPWLLECNYSPGLGGDCNTDEVVKVPMLHELFDLLGFPDKNAYSDESNTIPTTEIIDERNSKNPSSHPGECTRRFAELEQGVTQFDKEEMTRHYFDMLLTKLKFTTSENDKKMQKSKCPHDAPAKSEHRLNDAKSIYSQNLVVQYLKNQSTATTLSTKVRDQLISVAAKKLRSKLSEMSVVTGGSRKMTKNNKSRPCSRTSILELSDSSEDQVDEDGNEYGYSTFGSCVELSGKTKPALAASLMNKIQHEFPAPDSEAFQKLKYYFDAGVDYPMDSKTGKFKGCPALISVKKDWFTAPTRKGGWIRVYPFNAKTTKSPYKSSLSDIRQAVKCVDSYIKIAEHLYLQFPNESDDFFRQKMKAISRRDTEMWTPPSPTSQADPPTMCIGPGPVPNNDLDKTTLRITETDLSESNNNVILKNTNNSFCWRSSE